MPGAVAGAARLSIGLAVLLLAACGGGAPGEVSAPQRGRAGDVPASRLDVLRAGAGDAGFARAIGVRRFQFPQDHGPHPEYRDEWWYFTGHLEGSGGQRFGFEVTFFRVALAPPLAPGRAPGPPGRAPGPPGRAPSSAPGPAPGRADESPVTPASAASHWRARQIYVAHFAVTDIARRTFHSGQRVSRDALGLAGAQAAPFRVWLGDWSVSDARAGVWTLKAADADYGLTLELRALLPPVLNGDRGLSVKSSEPGAASYYYSIPRLAVRGRLVRRSDAAAARSDGAAARSDASAARSDGAAARAAATGASGAIDVTGTAWLDREWGSGSLGAHQQGWDWYALQLADGSALMFYALRDEPPSGPGAGGDVDTGTGGAGTRDPHSAGTWIEADGTAHALESRDVRIDVLKHWTSPGGGRYPAQWRVRVGSLGLDVTATPVLANQELETTPRYWEGDVEVTGVRRGRPISGQGYVELVGYADH